jgi:hypothetical protein
MGAFRRGFRSRSPLVLLTAAVLLLPALLGFQWLFTSGAWTVVPLDRVLRNPQDSFIYVSWMVGRARREPPDTPGLYLLGGSSARESIVDGDALAAEIAALGGPPVAAYDLGSMNQSFAESLAVVDSVPDTPAWLLIGVNLGRFTATREHNAQQAEGREFLLGGAAIREFVASEWGLATYQFTILPGIWSYITGWSRVHGRAALEGQPPSTQYRLHRYSEQTQRSDRQKERMVTVWNTRRRPVFEENVRDNLQLLEALLQRAGERDVRVVLLELPLNEEVVRGRFATSQQQYRRPVSRLARRYDVPYVDLNADVDIPSADFQDLSHLIAPGRVVWQRALAEELVRIMDGGDAGGSGG